jgi:PKD repeat protein
VTLAAAVSPTSGQPGVHTINVTGSSFPGGTIPPGNITVRLQPATPATGPIGTAPATVVTTLTGTSRRVSFQVPAVVIVGTPTAYRVSLSGTTSGGVAFASSNTVGLTINPPPKITSVTPAIGQPGQTQAVQIRTTYTNFVTGVTRAGFGPGTSVGGAADGQPGPVTVLNATTATAQVTVSGDATARSNRVQVTTGLQVASLDNAFRIEMPNRAPTPVTGGPYRGETGAPVAFNGTGSSDPDGDPLSFAWDFGDGAVGDGPTPSHTYASAGQFTVTLAVTDARGARSTAVTTATIEIPNRAPIAVTGGPYRGETGTPVAFNGTGSSDPDGDALSFAWDFGDGAVGDGPTPSHTYASAGQFTVSLAVTDARGARSTAVTTATIEIPNRAPIAVTGGPYRGETGTPVAFNGAGSNDPDGDALSFAWDFGDGTVGDGPTPSHTYANPGEFAVTLAVTDARGARSTAVTTARIDPPVVLQAIRVSPEATRLTESGAERALTVTGVLSNGTTRNLTAPATGTTYESSNPFVASVTNAGLVSAVASGVAVITARHEAFDASAQVTVEIGVTLDALALAPGEISLRAPGATRQLTLTGTFSDASVRDLSAAGAGTTYESTDPAVATVSADGAVTAVGNGQARIVAANEGRHAEARVTVAFSGGPGFLRGQVFDDTRGLPLTGATATLLADGGGALAPAPAAPTDDQGQFALTGRSGEALVRLDKAGFTSVERQGGIPEGTAATLLDGRLTPLDAAASPITSAFGGVARNTAATASLDVPPGSLTADAAIRLTLVSGQGLQGRLPLGWAPLVAVDVTPHDLSFGQPARLRVPNTLSLPAGSAVARARYDAAEHNWVALEPAQVTPDGREIEATLAGSGQIAFLVPDSPPHTPAAAVVGQALAGVPPVTLPGDLTATGVVMPRAAPPGDGARADGRIAVVSGTPLPSGMVVQGRVTERYDLLDGGVVVPFPFTQDLVVYAAPRTGDPPGLGATFPITPSRAFTLQELGQGKVRVDIVTPGADVGGRVVDATGALVIDSAGNSVEVPAGALAAGTPVSLRPLAGDETQGIAPGGYTVVAGVQLELAGATLAQGAMLSVGRPAALPDGAQVIVAQIVADPAGSRRLRIVALGEVQASRVVSRSILGSLPLPGVVRGGQYVFLRSEGTLGFIAGVVRSIDATTPQALALVTTDTAPFAEVTGLTGTYVVAGVAGSPTRATAAHVATGDAAAATVTIAAPNEVVPLDLVLQVVAPTVVATTPAAGALNVPLNTPVVVQFSEPVDPATVTAASIVLQLGGEPVSGQRSLSADRLTVTLRPDTELQPRSAYTLVLTGAVRDLAGHGLVPSLPIQFSTLDTAKPPQPPAGQITARLPDQDGLVMIFGTVGSAEAGTAVTATNLRSQETVTILAQTDGSFRLRIAAAIGDELALTFRTTSGQEQTLAVTQLEDPDGATGLGPKGGTITGAGGRIGRLLPRALSVPGVLRLTEVADPAVLPALPSGFGYTDRFDLAIQGGAFTRLRSLTLTESQNRFLPSIAGGAPFAATGSLVVPGDFLVNGKLFFSATAEDAGGTRESAGGATLVVAVNPATGTSETRSAERFPLVVLTAPREAAPNREVLVRAIAPTARVDFELPSPAGPPPGAAFLLARVTRAAGASALAVVDRVAVADVGGSPRLTTVGREFPGAAAPGTYAVVATAEPVAFVTGRATGPAAIVRLDGTPFVFETLGANGAFVVPVPAGQAFTLSFLDPATGESRGIAMGQAPAGGNVDLGEPLGASAGTLRVSGQPDPATVVDIATPIVLAFSEPVDARTVTPASVLVTDPAGGRVFGRLDVSADATRVTFTPSRRWRYGTRYRYGVSTAVLAQSGARLAQPFSGEFTTFAPRVVGRTQLEGAHDVAVTGTLALVGTPAGLAILDVTHPEQPVILDQPPVEGGVAGVALLAGPGLLGRNGQLVEAPLGLAAAGTEATGGALQLFGLAKPALPTLVATVPLTAAAGTTPPAGVPAVPGMPQAVAVAPGNRAVVAIQSVGVVSVGLEEAIPDDPANPGRALGPRYPPEAFESASDVAVLGDRILVAGAGGLVILDGTTLEKLGSVDTGATPVAVAGLPAFRMDVNGDGVIQEAGEMFDLAVVATGADGGVQLYNVQNPASLVLLSIVRVGGEAASVRLDAAENLAYVGSGARGVAIVDLAGPISLLPVDLDRNGIDDRVLGLVDTDGAAGRVALDLPRGVGYVADGIGGLAVLQFVPPRTAFQDILRDPVLAATGDEQSIMESRQAYVSDDALRVLVTALAPPQSGLALSIDEVPEAGGPRLLAFADGSTSASLVNGANALEIRVNKTQPATGSSATLKITTPGGSTVSSLDVSLTKADPGGATLLSLFVAPLSVVIPADQPTAQLSVGGHFADGRILNLTAASAGTTYVSGNPAVATAGKGGLITAVAGGTTGIVASNRDQVATAEVRSERPAQLVALSVDQLYVTLTDPGAELALRVTGFLSDGTQQDLTRAAGTGYSSSDAGVASVSADGVVQASGEGTATVTASNGAFQAEAQVAVEFRVPPNLTGLDLAPFTALITTDEGSGTARATVAGTGSLQGLTVTFTLSGPAQGQLTARTDYGGIAQATLTGLATPGTYTVTAAVVNPGTAELLSDSELLVVARGSGDHEPNDDPASASRLAAGKQVSGGIDSIGDPRDVFAIGTTTDARATISLTLESGSLPSDVLVVVRSADGSEFGRFTPSALSSTFQLDLLGGPALVSIETTGGPISYDVSVSFDPAPVVITSVTPTSGGLGTPVTITGSGFSSVTSENMVLFGTIAGKVTSATSTALSVLVPANARDGEIRVIVGAEEARGPQFTTGVSGPPLPALFPLIDPSKIRFDPVSATHIVVNELIIAFDALVMASEVGSLVANLGGSVVGWLPTFNQYIIRFPSIQTLSALEQARRQARADPRVAVILVSGFSKLASVRIDSRDSGANWGVTGVPKGIAFEQAGISAAIDQVRATHPFKDAARLGAVKIAIIDTGFAPVAVGDFDLQSVVSVRVRCPVDPDTKAPKMELCGFQEVSPDAGDPAGHGTRVTSIVAALNNDNEMSGVLGGLYRKGEHAKINVVVYGVPWVMGPNSEILLSGVGIFAALHDVGVHASGGSPFDAVNMSFGRRSPVAYEVCADQYQRFLRMSPHSLFVVAAGNDNRDTSLDCPANLSSEPNVMSVGAVAWSNLDKTGEFLDQRARFGGSLEHYEGDQLCDDIPRSASNCGDAVSIAAPGEEVLTARPRSGLPLALDLPFEIDPLRARGTSFAAPLVAGVAGMLQAVYRGLPGTPAGQSLTPQQLRRLLIETGDDITRTWGDRRRRPPMTRLNALKAVVRVLGAPREQFAFVGDDKDVDSVVVGIPVNPLTGQEGLDPEVVALFKDSLFGRPLALAPDPTGRFLYVAARVLGRERDSAIFVLRTSPLDVLDVIPLPETSVVNGSSIAVSRDGRLLYAATVQGVRIVNLQERRVVEAFQDLSAPYKSLWNLWPRRELSQRRGALDDILSNRGGVIGVVLSVDGRTLYAATGRSMGGTEPGHVVPINVDLYTDADAQHAGLQSELGEYFTSRRGGTPLAVMRMSNDIVDQPKAVAISPDGKHAYLVHGGGTYVPVSPDTSRLNGLVGEAYFSLGYVGPLFGLPAVLLQNAVLTEQIVDELREIEESGYTLLNAPGLIGVFGTKATGAIVPPDDVFPSALRLGSNRGPIESIERVFAKRPWGMAISPDGKRALVPFFASGNFGVLDLDAQKGFSRNPNPPPGAFKGLIGVTPSLELDNHLWPDQPGDVALLFPWDIQYAQNGRFAVASHSGSSGHSFCWTQEGGTPVPVPCDGADEQRGAVSIIDDRAIGQDLKAQIPCSETGCHPREVPYAGRMTGYYSLNPICNAEPEIPPDPLGRCAQVRPQSGEVVTYLRTYRSSGSEVPFIRPRGVAIQPFVTFLSPRFGDRVALGDGVAVRWLDSRVRRVEFRVFEPEVLPFQDGATPIVPPYQVVLTADDLTDKAAKREFGTLFGSVTPRDGASYRIAVAVITEAGETLSSTDIVVTFEAATPGE